MGRPFIINDEGFYYKLKNGFCTNDKLFSIEDEWESIDSFYLSFYMVIFQDGDLRKKSIPSNKEDTMRAQGR